MGMQQLIFELVAHLIDLALAFIDVLPERLFAFAVAHTWQVRSMYCSGLVMW